VLIVLSIICHWFPGDFLYLSEHIVLEIWEIFSYYFFEYILCTFGLDIFSFFNACDSQVWSFDGVFLCVSFTAHESFAQG
jgi:hypothetical protein